MNAEEHAQLASELLTRIETLDQRMATMSEEDKLQAIASGAMAKTNRDMEWTMQLACAHGLASLALSAVAEYQWGGR